MNSILPLSKEVLLQIAQEYGTPVYVYHAEVMRHQMQRLRSAFTWFPHQVYYAVKALTNIQVLRLLHGAGARMDCVSINEVRLCLRAGVPLDKILYTASCPSMSDIAAAVELGVHIHIDTLSVLEEFGKRFGGRKAVGVRINPLLPPSGGTLNISTAHAGSKFGIAISEIDEVIALVGKYQIPVVGLHQHTGSDVKDAGVLVEAMRVLGEVLPAFPQVEYLDIGGGFKVPYYADDVAIDVEQMAAAVGRLHGELSARHGRRLEIWFELGKYLVSQSGYMLTQVNAVKQTGEKRFAVVDSGFHHLIRPMFYGAYHHIENISREAEEEVSYDIVGILCETDTFAEHRRMAKLYAGDILALHNAGAYGYEMSSNFNSHTRPCEVLVDGGEIRCIRKRESVDDLLRNQFV